MSVAGHTAKGAAFMVDDEDVWALALGGWHHSMRGAYVVRMERLPDGSRRTVRLHRLLMGLEHGDPRQVDHINGDRSDNRRSNLRIVSAAENAQNRKPQRGRYRQTRYRGVFRRSEHRFRFKPWVAQCRIDGRLRTLGYFATEEEAAECAAQARRDHMPYSVEGR